MDKRKELEINQPLEFSKMCPICGSNVLVEIKSLVNTYNGNFDVSDVILSCINLRDNLNSSNGIKLLESHINLYSISLPQRKSIVNYLVCYY